MVKLFPFEGILYNQKIKKAAKLFTPPYDVISPEEQDAFYDLHDFNFIRLILGKEFSTDGKYNNRYIRAAAFLDGWLRHGILEQDDKPALYVYEQSFRHGKKKYSRVGFIGLLRLEDMGRGKVYPHEQTFPKAKIDRLELMRTTSANLENIFTLYSDEKGKTIKVFKKFMRRKPLFDVTDKNKVKHRFWRIDRKPSITKIIKEMRDKAVFIADGHHRYEAALRFKVELKTKNTKFSEEEAYNHVMMFFTPIEDKGLLVLPIHRVLKNLAFFDPPKFLRDLEQFYNIKAYKATKKTAQSVRKKLVRDLEKAGLEHHAFGLYLGNNQFFLLTLKDEKMAEELMDEEKPKAWKRLDTNILRYTIFDAILGLSQQTEDHLLFVKDEEKAINLVDKGGCQIAFLLNATKIEEIIAVASKLEKMPQKSTYFYPKLLSGLVLNKIVHGEKIKF